MLLNLARVLFILACMALGVLLASVAQDSRLAGALLGGALGIVVIGLEFGVARRYASQVPTLILGLALGFVAAQLASPAAHNIPWVRSQSADAQALVDVFLILLFSYLAVAVIVQTKDEFKFSIPYVQFRREGRGRRALLLDTSALIDGRILEIVSSGMLDAPLLLARPVLLELQTVADSTDRLKRTRGRRGLDVLQRLQANPRLEVRLDEAMRQGGEDVDQHLVRLAKRLDARLVTTDLNLEKVAQVEGVDVLNVASLANLLRPAVLAGEVFELRLVRPGDEPGQGVGFLEDGTMVVVEGARERVGQTVHATATNTLQTSAGRLVFAKLA